MSLAYGSGDLVATYVGKLGRILANPVLVVVLFHTIDVNSLLDQPLMRVPFLTNHWCVFPVCPLSWKIMPYHTIVAYVLLAQFYG